MVSSLNGILLIDKPYGISSAKTVALAGKAIGCKKFRDIKIGHCGTLDPLATGLLVLVVGKATKLATYLTVADKSYEGEIYFGARTDTYDLEGVVTATSDNLPTVDLLESSILAFQGTYDQIPPIYSAIKVNGKKACDLAREGKNIELSHRKITINSINVIPLEYNEFGLVQVAKFQVNCSKGTYIRSLIRDIGESLGCGAYLKSLRRTTSVPFSLNDAIDVANVTINNIIPISQALNNLYHCQISEDMMQALGNGNKTVLQSLINQYNLNEIGSEMVTYGTKTPAGILIRHNNNWKFCIHIGE
jgi:tRNA pseudouridine55 synthase